MSDYEEPVYGWQADGKSIKFDGEYGRVGRMHVDAVSCLGCGKQGPCLVSDQSEGEYNAAQVCRECIERLFAAVAP